MEYYWFLLGGVLCAAIGGELFIRGVVGIARWAKVSAGIIGATFAAFATSSPELSIAVTSALAGTPQVSLGDALGSNVVNIALILAIALLIAPLQASRESIRRDFSMALLVPVVLALFSLDGMISRVDGLVLLIMFVAWISVVLMEARRQRSAVSQVLAETKHGRAVAFSLGGVILLILAGRLIVWGAQGLAIRYGFDPFVIGATLVALGTSVPELATVVISRRRGHDEVGLGTILGSNIFNGLLIIGLAAFLHPIKIELQEVSAGLVFGLLVVACTVPLAGGWIGRRRGILLLCLYVAYLAVIMQGGAK
jgi:cation:H+ antiporter